MPRQPYLPQFSAIPYSVGATVIEGKPEFAKIIGKFIAVWSYIENEMGTILGLLLGTQSAAALEVFLALRRSSSQREALSAAAKHELNQDELLVFEALMIFYKAMEAHRNDLAHGCFGSLKDVDDAVTWIEMKHHVHFMADVIAKEAQGKFTTNHAKLSANLFVYRLSDFESLYEEVNTLSMAALYFHAYLRHRRTQRTAASLLFRQLCEVPQIQQEMSRLKLARGTNPPIQ